MPKRFNDRPIQQNSHRLADHFLYHDSRDHLFHHKILPDTQSRNKATNFLTSKELTQKAAQEPKPTHL